MRAASSIWFQSVGGTAFDVVAVGLDGAGLVDGRGETRNSKLSCMRALRVWRQLTVPALETVDDGAQLEQIADLAEGDGVVAIVVTE